MLARGRRWRRSGKRVFGMFEPQIVQSDPQIDVRRLRALLAAERVTHTRYAVVCGLSRRYISRVLVGDYYPGELAQIKMRRGLATLGLDLGDRLDRQASYA